MRDYAKILHDCQQVHAMQMAKAAAQQAQQQEIARRLNMAAAEMMTCVNQPLIDLSSAITLAIAKNNKLA